MVSFNLKESVIRSSNTFFYEKSQFTGHPVDKILSQNWVQLSNTKVSDILMEAARPRTIENIPSNLCISWERTYRSPDLWMPKIFKIVS